MFAAVTDQPTVSAFPAIRGLPLGLQKLAESNKIQIDQHLDLVEVILGWSRPNRYSVYHSPKEDNQHFLYIEEVSDCYARQCLGAARSFILKFTDQDLNEVVQVERMATCTRGCCCLVSCNLPELSVETPPGVLVATIREEKTCFRPVYQIYDAEDTPLYSLQTKCCYPKVYSCFSDISIMITDVETGDEVAELIKQTKKSGREFTGAENKIFIEYLKDLDVKQKVILLCSMFLIDFHFFEHDSRWCC
ncbi:hypothetical protein CHS0354_042447 [Potamilus streckersoni]|uniref:Phospholipid scramblase n=1 Tax=Potamilus streckersoni TaxID=2493646 RepID=A0AAE0S9U1_9BIVA|nr:hypothetical protein CHS0354_042447 [Potamilus streckersoni]